MNWYRTRSYGMRLECKESLTGNELEQWKEWKLKLEMSWVSGKDVR